MDVAIGHMVVPHEVVDIFLFLHIHGDPFKTVGYLYGDRIQPDTPSLLKIGELGNLHPVEPDLPSETRGPEGG